jgi:hypothetical protein
MKAKFFRATPGWGTLDIDSVINEWLQGKKIKIIELQYSTHTDEFETHEGLIKKGIVYTATLLYEEST